MSGLEDGCSFLGKASVHFEAIPVKYFAIAGPSWDVNHLAAFCSMTF